MPKKKKKVSSSSAYYELFIPTFLVILLTIGVFIFANQTDENENAMAKYISASPKQPMTSDTLLSIAIKINGLGQGGNILPQHNTRKVTIYLYGTTTSKIITKTVSLTYDGTKYFTGIIHVGKLAEGPYFIKLTDAHTLQVLSKPEIQTLTSSRVNVLSPYILYPGDMNDDNVLNKSDYNLALSCFQTTNCPDDSVDFNDDGMVNILDYNLLLQTFTVLHDD
jgi:hypothetical protein